MAFYMGVNYLGTVAGKAINQNMIDDYAVTFARDWCDSEVEFSHTERSTALNALSCLNIPVYEIEALERRAVSNQQSLSLYIRTILKHELLTSTDP